MRYDLTDEYFVPRRIVMSPPSFTTLPREIRDRIYDFVWDLGRDVSLSAPRLTRRKQKIVPFVNFPAETMLALLQVNHQISAEAAPIFYGERVFCSLPELLIPFLGGIGLRQYLLRDISLESPNSAWLWLHPQTFEVLQILNSLRSFTMKIRTYSFKQDQDDLVHMGIHKLTNRMDVTVHWERSFRLPYDGQSESEVVELMEDVILTNTMTCAKGETEWRSKGFRCRVLSRMNEELIWVRQVNLSSQPCDHENHSTGRDWGIAR